MISSIPLWSENKCSVWLQYFIRLIGRIFFGSMMWSLLVGSSADTRKCVFQCWHLLRTPVSYTTVLGFESQFHLPANLHSVKKWGDSPGLWVPTTHMRDLDWILDCQLSPEPTRAVANIWGVHLQMNIPIYSLSFFVFEIRWKYMNTFLNVYFAISRFFYILHDLLCNFSINFLGKGGDLFSYNSGFVYFSFQFY